MLLHKSESFSSVALCVGKPEPSAAFKAKQVDVDCRTIVFGEVRDDGLGVALGPEGAGLQQGLFEVDAAGVDVQAGGDVVERVHHQVQRGPEGIVEHGLRLHRHPILQRPRLEARVQGCCSCAAHGCLGPAT